MAAISGKYGSVQRILPHAYDVNTGKPIWSESSNGGKTWTPGAFSRNWTTAAFPAVGGLEPDSSHSAYSNTVSAVQSWSLENNTATQSYAASNTRGYNAKFAGIRSCTGSFSGIGAFPPLNPGDQFLFRGFVGPDSGNNLTDGNQLNTVGTVYQVAAIVTNVQIQINYSNYSPVTWTIQWQSNWNQEGDQLLAFNVPESSAKLGFYDLTDPPCNNVIPSTTHMLCIAKTQKDARDAASIDVCLESANIAFTTQTQQIANSCSAGAGGWQQSIIGTTDVTLDATIHSSRFDAFSNNSYSNDLIERSKDHYPGFDRYVRIYLGNNKYAANCGAWEFNKMFLGSYTGLNVDVASGNIVSFRTQMEFNAFPREDDYSGCSKGFIRYRKPNTFGTSITNDTQDKSNNWLTINADKTEDTTDPSTLDGTTSAKGWVSFLDLRS